MSTSERYPDDRRLAGRVTFEPENVPPEEVAALVGPDMSRADARTVSRYASARPSALAPYAETIADCLSNEDPDYYPKRYLAEALAALVPAAPTAADALVEFGELVSEPESRHSSSEGIINAIGRAAETNPAGVTDCLDLLEERLTDDRFRVRQDAIEALAPLARHTTEGRERIQQLLSHPTVSKRTGAARVVGTVLERGGDVPDGAVESVVALFDDAEFDIGDREEIETALADIATAQPERVAPISGRLFEIGDEGNAVAIEVLGEVAKADADVFAAMLARGMPPDPVYRYCPHVNVAADRHPQVVAANADVISAALETPDDEVRGYAITLVNSVAEEFPGAVGFAVDPLLFWLSQETHHPDPDTDLLTRPVYPLFRTFAGEFPAVQATVVGMLANVQPSRLDTIKSIFGVGRPSTREPAAIAARHVAEDHPTVLYDAGAVPHLVDALGDGGSTAGNAAWALARIAEHHPDVMRTAAEPITDLVANRSASRVPDGAYHGLLEVARQAPNVAIRASDAAFDSLENRGNTTDRTLVGILASGFQSEFDRLVEALERGSIDAERVLATMAVAAETDPGTAVPYVDRIAHYAATSGRRPDATRALAGIAAGAAEAVDPHAELVAALVYDPDSSTRKAACDAAAGLFRDGPGEYDRLRDRVARVADRDEEADVRAAAADALDATGDATDE